MKYLFPVLLLGLLCCVVGCEASDVPPTTNFTDEQIEQIKAEDSAVEDEESQGKMKKK